VAHYVDAFSQILEDPRIDPNRIYVYGSSLGSTDQYGRPYSWHQQAAKQNFLAAWTKLDAPVLVIFNAFDQFELRHGHKLIVDTMNRLRPDSATFIERPNIGHSDNRYATIEDAYAFRNGTPTWQETAEIMQTATAFGLIWAGLVIASGMIANIGNSTVIGLFSEHQNQAVSLWLTIITVQEALGGGNEIVGGLWVLLLSWAALRAGNLPKVLNYLGALVGLAGILTVVPAFDVLMDVFGLGQIAWYLWLGIVMLREKPSAT